jgi:hypothetical protein
MDEFPRVIYGHDSSGDPRCVGVDGSGILEVSATRVSGWKTATITVAEDDDLTDEIDLGEHFRYLAVVLPSLDEARVGVEVSIESGGTFTRLGDGSNAQTALTTGGYATVFDIGGWRFVKLSTSAGQSADRTFSLQGVRG